MEFVIVCMLLLIIGLNFLYYFALYQLITRDAKKKRPARGDKGTARTTG